MGYWFCYQNTSNTTGDRVNISTVLLLENMGTDYTIVRRFNVTAIPDEDSCLPGKLVDECCVSRNLSTENQFEVNSSYLYGVVDLADGPNMRQTHESVGRPGYIINIDVYTQSGDTLRKRGNPTRQPLMMFQFIIGELRVSFADESDNTVTFTLDSPKIGSPWNNGPTLKNLLPRPIGQPHASYLYGVVDLPDGPNM